MKLFMLFPILALMAACATNQATPAQNAQLSFSQACAAYSAAMATATQADLQNRLSKAAVASISQIDDQINPICSNPAPANPDQVITQITAATTALTINALEKVK